MGGFLISADAPASADIGVVLAGDFYAERLTKAMTLVESKLVPRVIVSGPKGSYGAWESDLAIDWAVKQGKPRDWFVPLKMDADSTVEEAKVILPWLREHQMKRIVVVTSNFHTRRSGAIWRSLGPDMDIQIVAAPCRDFDPDHWWRTRRGQKTFALEWLKTFAWWVGL